MNPKLDDVVAKFEQGLEADPMRPIDEETRAGWLREFKGEVLRDWAIDLGSEGVVDGIVLASLSAYWACQRLAKQGRASGEAVVTYRERAILAIALYREMGDLTRAARPA